jgi:hypothetical protein
MRRADKKRSRQKSRTIVRDSIPGSVARKNTTGKDNTAVGTRTIV